MHCSDLQGWGRKKRVRNRGGGGRGKVIIEEGKGLKGREGGEGKKEGEEGEQQRERRGPERSESYQLSP